MYPEWFSEHHLDNNPAKRPNIQRLDALQKDAFLKLIRTDEWERTARDLWDAGIVRPDWSLNRFMRHWTTIPQSNGEFYLSDEFLKKWLATGTISHNDLPSVAEAISYNNTAHGLRSYRRNHTSDDYDIYDGNRFINMMCAVIDDRQCFLWRCYLPYAKFDSTDFYKAFIKSCVLDGATAYESSFEDCNGFRDCDWHVLRHLVSHGMVGINLHLLQSDDDEDVTTDEEK